jgi:hypothetical protein
MQRRQADGVPDPNTPAIMFNVEIGPNSNPLMRVRIRDRDFPLELSASQASSAERCSPSVPFATMHYLLPRVPASTILMFVVKGWERDGSLPA